MVWTRLVMVVVTMVMTTGHGQDTRPYLERQHLRQRLLQDYDKETIPLFNTKQLKVTLSSFSLKNLEMLEETHRLHIHAWAGFTWLDKRLSWNPDNSNGIDSLTFNPQHLWLPDLSIYNAASAGDTMLVFKNRLTVTHDGNVLTVIPIDFSFSCLANLTYWPHDVHKCRFNIGSWVYDRRTIGFLGGNVFFSEMERMENENPGGIMDTLHWEMIGHGLFWQEVKRACCNESFVNLGVMFNLVRKAHAYQWLIKVPVFCLILLTMVVFILPPGAGEKITFGGLCLLLNLIFLVFARDTVLYNPSHMPILVQLVVVQLAVTATSVLIASWVVRVARGPYFSSPPSILHRLFRRIAPFLGLSVYVKQTPGPGRAGMSASKEELEMTSEGGSGEPSEYSGISAQWVLFGAVLDRVVLGLYLIVVLVMLIKFFMI